MKKITQLSLITLVLLLALVGYVASQPIRWVNAQATIPTPTANAEGKVIYVVQPGDFCATIAEKTGVDLAIIKSLNNLDEACSIYEKQELVLAQLDKPTPTPLPAPTMVPVEVTPTATPGTGIARICVVLFNDMDGNGRRTDFEAYLYGGVAGVNDQIGQVSRTGNTVAGDPAQGVTPLCFEDLPEGNYNVTMAIPEGFNPTTMMNFPLTVHAGETATIDFGAQESISMPATAQQEAASGRSPVLGIIGGLILLAGLGLGFYMWRQRKI